MAKNNPPRNARTAAPRSTPSRRAPSRTPFYAGLIALVVIGAGVLLYIAKSPASASSAATDAAYQALASNYANAGPPQPYTLGNPSAPVTIEEFADFECPVCGRYAVITEPDVRTRIVQAGQAYYKYYDFPLPQHRNSMAASNAAACAADQGKFWEMHDQLFNGQADWGLGPDETEVTTNVRPIFLRYAKAIGLNTDQWAKCFDAHKDQPRVSANLAEGFRRKIDQTPTFYVNGKMLPPGEFTFDQLQQAVTQAAQAARANPPAAAKIARPAATVPADTAGVAPRSPAPTPKP